MGLLRISVITVAKNSEKYLEDTIRSVDDQTYENIEYIVIDGGSIDRTIDIIHRNDGSISHWISEPDSGISDAMNKGINLSTGEYIIFLNSDDYFSAPDIIEKAVGFLRKNNHVYIFKVFLDDGVKKTISGNRGLNLLTNFKMGSSHQGHICSRKLYETIGKFDSAFDITMDYDLMLRAYRAGFKSVSLDMVLSTMRLVGVSSQRDWRGLKDRFDEERKAHNKNAQNYGHRLLYWVYWSVYIQYRKILYFFHSA